MARLTDGIRAAGPNSQAQSSVDLLLWSKEVRAGPPDKLGAMCNFRKSN